MSLRIKVIITVFSVLILSFGVYLGIIASNYTVPILMYHYINDQEPLKSRLGVSPKAFERQMRFLKEHRYNVLPFEELVNIVRERKKFPPRTVAITFDDGYLDNFTAAYPILKRYGIPAPCLSPRGLSKRVRYFGGTRFTRCCATRGRRRWTSVA